MTPEQLQAAPCKNKTAMFTVPTDLDPNPHYNERRAKGLCALCPASTFNACGAEAEGDHVMIRVGLTPKERNGWTCRVCYGTDFDTVRHSGTGKPTRRCSACHRAKVREYRARGR